MNYATLTDMLDRFGELELMQVTDRDGTGQVNAQTVGRALADATAFADGYLGRIYQLPLRGCAVPPATVGGAVTYVAPPVLTRVVCDLARYYLMPDIGEKHEAGVRYRAAAKDLQALADGSTQLACPLGGTAGEPLHANALEESAVYHSFAPRQLNADSLRGFA